MTLSKGNALPSVCLLWIGSVWPLISTQGLYLSLWVPNLTLNVKPIGQLWHPVTTNENSLHLYLGHLASQSFIESTMQVLHTHIYIYMCIYTHTYTIQSYSTNIFFRGDMHFYNQLDDLSIKHADDFSTPLKIKIQLTQIIVERVVKPFQSNLSTIL